MHGTYYRDYLKLNKLLGSQEPVTRKEGNEVHDEMLFIVVHQVYELWFKQILHELRSIENIFSRDQVPEKRTKSSCLAATPNSQDSRTTDWSPRNFRNNDTNGLLRV